METGFPSPAQGFEESSIDFHKFLVHRPAATFYFRMGRSRPEFAVYKGDILIADRSLTPGRDSLVVYEHGGAFCLNRFSAVLSHSVKDVCIAGVVMHIIHSTRDACR